MWQKALTTYQPWASLIIGGFKPWEFRGWDYRERYATLEGSRIGIHASARAVDVREINWIIIQMRQNPDRICLKPEALPLLLQWREEPHRLPLSAMLGEANLGTPILASDIATRFGATGVNDSERDGEANFGWPMLNPQPLEPIITPMRGRQGFWNWRRVA